MVYFSTRDKARKFAHGRKIIDRLKVANLADTFAISAGVLKRWGVKVTK